MSLTLDARKGSAFDDLNATLAPFRPGKTPLRIELITSQARGRVELNGSQGVRADPELMTALRAMQGVDAPSLSLARVSGAAARADTQRGD